MKKVLCIVTTMLILASISCFPAFADDLSFAGNNNVAKSSSGEISPFWVNCLAMTPTISKASGTYSCSISGLSGTTKITATLVLYEKNWLGNYKEVSRTSGTSYSPSHIFSGTYSFTSGKTYKLEVSGTVTRNGYAEPVSVSTEKTV